MAFMDEEILKQKKKIEEARKKFETQENMEKEAESSIYDEQVIILGKPVHFERREIEGLGLSVMLPTTFFRYTEEITRVVFPAGNPPTHFYGGEDAPFQFSLSLKPNKVTNDKIKDFLKLSEQMIKTVGPKATVVDKIYEERENFNLGILSFVSRALDMNVYNNQFYFAMEGGLIMGNLNFPSKYQKRFIKMAKEIILSIEKEEKNGSDNPS